VQILEILVHIIYILSCFITLQGTKLYRFRYLNECVCKEGKKQRICIVRNVYILIYIVCNKTVINVDIMKIFV